jgi:acyl-coenzyme A synthetase/AMP-(fatty) acid ligase
LGRPAFTQWIGSSRAGNTSGAWVNGEFATWERLKQRAMQRAKLLQPGYCYVVDAAAGIEAIVSLLAVAMTPRITFLWANAQKSPFEATPIAPALLVLEHHRHEGTRPLYGTLTSGTAGAPKMPFAFADMLELVALHYDAVLYRPTFAAQPEIGALATSLPLEYAASFIMVVIPAMFLKKDLIAFPVHDWSPLRRAASNQHIVCLTVPGITAAAVANTPDPMDMGTVALIMASGYLSAMRCDAIRSTFRGVTLMNCYGAAETGVVSLDRAPGTHFHVGAPIPGKPVWIDDPDPSGIGRLATAGVDCREFYWDDTGDLKDLKRADTSVAATDLAHFDDDGNLYLDGRLDGGEKLHGVTVYPRQIERHLLQLDGVVDVTVSVSGTVNGIDHLRARVVGTVSADQVREHCQVLPDISRPSVVECVSDDLSYYTEHGKLRTAEAETARTVIKPRRDHG